LENGKMALAQSPSIVTNGLVFYYDMNNVKKSWLGRPVTNQFTLPSDNVNGFGVQNSTFTRIRTGTYAGYDIQPTDYVWRYNVTGNDCPYHGWDIPTTAGAVVTFSFDYYIDPTTTNYPVTNYLANFENTGSGVSGSVGDSTPSIKGVWKRAYFSSTASATGNSRCLLYPGACGGRLGDAGFILYKNPQVEFNAPGSIPTPFVAGTRSSTQAVLDLTNQAQVTATSLTYASDGTFSFNGSSDYLSIPNTTLGNGNVEWTVSCWMKTTTTTNSLGGGSVLSNISGGPVYSMMGVNNGKIVYWTYQNSAWAQKLGTGKTVNDGNWHMLTWVNYANYTMDMYVDGLLDSNVANSTSGNNNPVDVIGRSWAAYFPGSIASMSRYSRALTRNEVFQNFAAQRGIYGV
jgi:hypothetical protein